MRSPFCDTDKAFEPFYDKTVVVKLKSGEKQTIQVSVFDDIEGQALNEDVSMDTDRKDINLIARRSDWWFVKGIKRGDTIYVDCGKVKYSVSSVKNDDAMGIVIQAREM